MDRQELLKKLAEEVTLTAEESAALEAELARPGQTWVKSAVSQLPVEEPSMAWRAELNEKLRRESAMKRHEAQPRRFRRWFVPTCAAAGAMLAVYFAPSAKVIAPEPTPSTNSVDSQLMAVHDEFSYGVEYATTTTPIRSAEVDPHLFDWVYETYEL